VVCDKPTVCKDQENGPFPLKFGFANGAGGKYPYFYRKTGKNAANRKCLK
jgi:hypothetical protein